MIADGDARQWTVMWQIQADGVELSRWPAESLVAFEDAIREVVMDEPRKNPDVAGAWECCTAFREIHDIRGRSSFLQ